MKKIYVLFFLTAASGIIFVLLGFVMAARPSVCINEDIVKLYIETNGQSNKNLKDEIVAAVLSEADKAHLYEPDDNTTLKIIRANVIPGDNDEVIFLIEINDNRTVAAVYESFEFKAVIDTFTELKDFQTMRIDDEHEMIIVREYVNQMLGAFEEGTYIRGYIWDDVGFVLALNIVERYNAYWNELWDNHDYDMNYKSYWLKTSEKSEVIWHIHENKSPDLNVITTRSFYKSIYTDTVEIPDNGGFEMFKRDSLNHELKWSAKWNHFILNEGLLIKTNEEVAILDDYGASPFYTEGGLYRIKRKSGDVIVADKKMVNPF